jgi:hypothetical protein
LASGRLIVMTSTPSCLSVKTSDMDYSKTNLSFPRKRE